MKLKANPLCRGDTIVDSDGHELGEIFYKTPETMKCFRGWEREVPKHPPYVTVTRGGRGFFAVLLTWSDGMGMYEPFNTGSGSYKSSKGAEAEAKQWAEAEGISYGPPNEQ